MNWLESLSEMLGHKPKLLQSWLRRKTSTHVQALIYYGAADIVRAVVSDSMDNVRRALKLPVPLVCDASPRAPKL